MRGLYMHTVSACRYESYPMPFLVHVHDVYFPNNEYADGLAYVL